MSDLGEWTTVGDEQRQVIFTPAFHRCTDPEGNFGIGSVTMWFALRMNGWAIAWYVFTGWDLPDDAFKAASPGCTHHMHQNGAPHHKGSGGAVTFHSPVPLFEDSDWATEPDHCEWIDGLCYSDVGYILGSRVFDLMCTDGGGAVWVELRRLLEIRMSAVIADG